MNKFAFGVLAGMTAGTMGMLIAGDKSLRRKIINKSEDIIEKAETISEKCMKR